MRKIILSAFLQRPHWAWRNTGQSPVRTAIRPPITQCSMAVAMVAATAVGGGYANSATGAQSRSGIWGRDLSSLVWVWRRVRICH